MFNLSLIQRFMILLIIFIAVSCGSNSSSEKETKQEENLGQVEEKPMESISAETMQHLWNSANSMDLIMYNASVSVSQDNQNAIRSTLRFISEKPALVPPTCKPEGRISFLSNGEIDAEADVYFSNGCAFFVFMENGKPRFGNQMTPDGVSFFNQLLQAKPQ